ncbi:MAG: S8 family serine peptidase [Phycisphaeraceae bacterium]|nr:S8 family serine peptidase [Phycisphaeraceae bacterium]
MRRLGGMMGAAAVYALLGTSAVAQVNAGREIDPGLIPVVVVMKEQAPPFDVVALRSLYPKPIRREVVIATLREVAGRTQRGVLDELIAAQSTGHADNVRPLWITNAIAARVTPEVEAVLAARPDVAFVHRESVVGFEVFPTIEGNGSPVTAGVTCGITAMKAPQVWAEGNTGQGVVVAVIDTGTCITHPDILNQIWLNPGEIPDNGIDDDGNGFVDDVYGWNFEKNNNNIDSTKFHGPHVAGTVAGDGTQGTVCGIAPGARIMTLKFWDNVGGGEASVWNSIEYALANGADVVNGSFGWLPHWNPKRDVWRQVCENAFASGAVLVFAAGNEWDYWGIGSVRTPADVPDMIAVGATDCLMYYADFSSQGPVTWMDVAPFFDWPYPPGKLKPTISAPGVDTISHKTCNGYSGSSGTSMATPHVSGGIALILRANPNLDHYEVKQILKDTAIDRGTPGPDNKYGHGFVDILAAVQMAKSMLCPADLNGDGIANTLDLLQFLNWFAAKDPRADWNQDGMVNTIDVIAYMNAWAGCQ